MSVKSGLIGRNTDTECRALEAQRRNGAGICVVERLEGRSLFSMSPDIGIAPPISMQISAGVQLIHPSIVSVKPALGAANVATTAFVSAELAIPNGGVNSSTLTSSNVYLVVKSNGMRVPANVNTSGGGDIIVLKPFGALAFGTEYSFVVSSGVKDVSGVSFTPFQSSFTVGTISTRGLPLVKFEQKPQASTNGHNYFGLTMGPDGRLYAGTDKGELMRFPLSADGALGNPTVINTISRANGGPRFVVGLVFDPASTAANPILWVTHSATSALQLGGTAGADWTGKVSRLSGINLSSYSDAVIHLPRSVRDHVTNQCVFGPDGALYFGQPSQSAMGRADVTWGSREEHLLSATILRLDVKNLGNATLDARTADGGGTYDPATPGSLLTIYASGVRNAFDLVWDHNGQLYAPGNGSAAGGNTPAGGNAVALTNVGQSETDFLFRIEKGGYYGHPNPLQRHYVLNGGNPTSIRDPYEVIDYPVGTPPDPNWKPAVFNMGAHQSPDGIIEYHGAAFSGALEGKLLVCRYSGGDDVVALDTGGGTGSVKQYAGMTGMTGLKDPVDLIEDSKTGYLYVAELGAQRITLLRPIGSATPAVTSLRKAGSAPLEAIAPSSEIPASVNSEPLTPAPLATSLHTEASPIAISLSRSERRLVWKIKSFCQRIGSGVPHLDGLHRLELKALYKEIRKVWLISKRNQLSLPELEDTSAADLKSLLVSMRN